MMKSSHDTLLSAWQVASIRNPLLTTLLFDLDGTLVNTMALHYEAYAHVLKRYGGHLARSDFDRLVGPPAATTIPSFVKAAGLGPLGIQTVHAQKKDTFEEILVENCPELLPAGHLLLDVKEEYQIAVVTSGNAKGATAILKATNLWPHIEVLITGDDVSRGKPDPEPYRYALEQLRASHETSLVFEDHENGLRSAQRAGISAIDVETYTLMDMRARS